MTRVPDWPERLSAWVEHHRARPFAWGTHDCVLFAAGAVEAVTGARPPLPHWGSHEEARSALREVRGLRHALDARMPRVPVAQAQRGDLLLVAQPGDPLLAVCVGDKWCAPGEAGLMFGRVLDARMAWRIG